MPTLTIPVLDIQCEGAVATVRVKNIITAILKVQSIMLDIPEELLDNTIDIRNGELEIEYNYQGGQGKLIAPDLIAFLADFIVAVGQAIHDRPENPDMRVLGPFGQTQRNFDQIVDVVRENHRVFTHTGLFNDGRVLQRYLTPIRHVLPAAEDVNVFLVCISSVCVIEQQPYVDFFRLNDDRSLRYRAETIITIECHTTVEQAQKLEELRMSTKAEPDKLHIWIEVIKDRRRGKDYQLMKYKLADRNQNLNLDLE